MKEVLVLQALMQRLSEIPSLFLYEPVHKMKEGRPGFEIHVPALITDLIYDAGGPIPDPDSLSGFLLTKKKTNLNFLRLTAICCYIFHDPVFLNNPSNWKLMLLFLKSSHLKNLAGAVEAREFVQDMERREELIRVCLHALKLYLDGENRALARDRLNTLDSLERKRLLEKSRAVLERARKLREAMARKKAEEAASKMYRE